MSSLGIEPPTSAKVVLHTTKGPIEIEIWAKEIPKASRNFIQLCLDGYYDNCIFHRVVPDFIVQSGDPTGTGYGGTSIYEGGTFEDEFHSRIRYSRRGMVGCANMGHKSTNGSQFIITLTSTPELNNKNTCFGRVMGETLFNILQISELETDENERPLYPPKIERAEVVIPYFDDLIYGRKSSQVEETNDKKKGKKKAAVRLSYGDEEEDEESAPVMKKVKMRSAHELLGKKAKASNKDAKRAKKNDVENSHGSKEKDGAASELPNTDHLSRKQTNPPSKSIENEIAELKSSLKKSMHGSEVLEKEKPEPSSVLDEIRALYKPALAMKKTSANMLQQREKETLNLLSNFQSKIHETQSSEPQLKPETHKQPAVEKPGEKPRPSLGDSIWDMEEEEEIDLLDDEPLDDDWMDHKFESNSKRGNGNDDSLVTMDSLKK
ncbi:hypothetical protein TRVA0_004S01464 [Trichomonascus vanleenenianus]|uniref:uncharacterized protein n=1 Tax=Trichomonascus vanleenenianus TaxID=2268995 RepID=UPI003ECB641F